MGIELNNLYLRDEAQEWVPFKDWDMSKIINENADAEDEITVGEFFNNASPMNNYLPLSGGTLTGPVKSSNNNITKNNIPISNIYTSNYIVSDSNDDQIGYVGAYQSTGGIEGINIGTSRVIDGNSEYNSINIGIDSNGTKTVYFDDADTKIAWQNALGLGSLATKSSVAAGTEITGILAVSHGGTGITATPSMVVQLNTTAADTIFKTNPSPGITGTLAADHGGTGQTSLQATRNAMGLGNTTGALPIANGGTSLTAAPSMLTDLSSTAAKSILTASPRPGITGTLTVSHGGTGLTAAPSMLVNLGSTATASVFTASPRPGITGTLGVAHGGTGKTTATEAWTNLGGGSIGKLNTVSATNISSVSASVITGTLGVAHGGTGVTSVAANKVFAGPGSGSAAAPAFRSLVSTDLPSIPTEKIQCKVLWSSNAPGKNSGSFSNLSLPSGNHRVAFYFAVRPHKSDGTIDSTAGARFGCTWVYTDFNGYMPDISLSLPWSFGTAGLVYYLVKLESYQTDGDTHGLRIKDNHTYSLAPSGIVKADSTGEVYIMRIEDWGN